MPKTHTMKRIRWVEACLRTAILHQAQQGLIHLGLEVGHKV